MNLVVFTVYFIHVVSLNNACVPMDFLIILVPAPQVLNINTDIMEKKKSKNTKNSNFEGHDSRNKKIK
jgi:hypothetical protein